MMSGNSNDLMAVAINKLIAQGYSRVYANVKAREMFRKIVADNEADRRNQFAKDFNIDLEQLQETFERSNTSLLDQSMASSRSSLVAAPTPYRRTASLQIENVPPTNKSSSFYKRKLSESSIADCKLAGHSSPQKLQKVDENTKVGSENISSVTSSQIFYIL